MKDLQEKDDYAYEDIIDSFEVAVIVEVTDNDYQGDSRFLLRDGTRYGLLTFGWGSCSGCDALEACNNADEATQLRDALWSEVHWEPNAEVMLQYVSTKDWTLDYSFDQSFLDQVKAALTPGNL